MRDFRNYEVWKLSHALVLKAYEKTSGFPKEELFGVTSQLRRAAVSVPTNIAEGCGRDSDAEFNKFLTIAQGSMTETEYLVLLSRDLSYISTSDYEVLNSEINLIKRKIYSLKQKLK